MFEVMFVENVFGWFNMSVDVIFVFFVVGMIFVVGFVVSLFVLWCIV